MRTSARAIAIAFAAGASLAPFCAHAFESGSTGADGIFSPTVSVAVPLPPSGIFNYTSVNIPAGVTVTYLRNATNTPVVILASGNVTIGGTLNVSGTPGASTGAAGDGALGDDGAPGIGGPGGFDGGRGGLPGQQRGGAGLGPGGGGGGGIGNSNCGGVSMGGGGGGFAGAGANSTCGGSTPTAGGAGYGSPQILPLIGGSGGGGGNGGSTLVSSGGGGGGGALLIAASGTVTINGSVLANGGAGGATTGGPAVSSGGGGSGGAIRIVATVINGAGALSAAGGAAGTGVTATAVNGGLGAPGRIRLEYETTNRSAVSNPPHTTQVAGTPPGPVFVAGTPTLRIASVAGVAAPAAPTGSADITLPASTPNPVTVAFETSGVPVGNTVQLTVTPAFGDRTVAVTPALTGSTTSATASVNVNLPVGPSVLSAQTTFTVVAAVGDLLKNFAGNERVERVTLLATLGGSSKARLTTVSGKEYEVPADVLRIAALGG